MAARSARRLCRVIPSWQLLCADYSQIELRVLAHCSQDAALLQAFATDQDIHAQVAGQVYGVAPEAVTQEMRRAAKAINFGIIYGQSAFGLAKSLGIEKREAAEFIEAYFARYPGVDAFMDRVLAECREKGYVTTTLGRRRGIQGVRDVAERQRQSAAHDAGADCDQHGDPRFGGRPDQDGDDPRAATLEAGVVPRADAAADP